MDNKIITEIESTAKISQMEIAALLKKNPICQSWCTTLGAPASGKTTLLQGLIERNPNAKIVNSVLHLVANQNSQLRRYFEQAFAGKRDNFLFFQLEMLTKRLEQTLRVSESGGIVDGSICSTLAYSRALAYIDWLTADEYRSFFNWYLVSRSIIGFPKIVIYCYCSTDELKRRIEYRSRSHEKAYYSNEFVTALNMAFEAMAEEYRKAAVVKSVNTQSANRLDTFAESLIINECQKLRTD